MSSSQQWPSSARRIVPGFRRGLGKARRREQEADSEEGTQGVEFLVHDDFKLSVQISAENFAQKSAALWKIQLTSLILLSVVWLWTSKKQKN